MNTDTYFPNVEILIFLTILLVTLLIIKKTLLIKMGINALSAAKRIIIGNEEIQEDCANVICSNKRTLALLSDGLGKNESGRIASITAVKTISDLFICEGNKEKISYFLKKSFGKANKEIVKRVENENGGASVLAAVIEQGYLYYALVGEAVLCIYRNKELVRLTEGHSMSEVAKKSYNLGKIEKEKALGVINEEKILYYLGQDSVQNIETNEIPIKLKKKDIIVLMSRGIYETVRWVELEEILSQKYKSVEGICDDIGYAVEDNSTIYNASVVLLKYN